MTRIVHDFEQGSAEWHAHRATPGMINASELSAIIGLSSYVTYSEILRRKATGIEPEYDAATLARFAKGHAAEAQGRTIAETILCEDLKPAVMSDTLDGVLISVSLDGITECEKITLEHKLLNQYLDAALATGFIPEEYHPQCEAGLMVSRAEKCLFMASKDGDATTARMAWYYPNHDLRKKIIAVCKQFNIDRDNYQHVDAAVAPVAAHVEALPVLSIQVFGEIALTHNIKRFGEQLTRYIGSLNKKPETDQDFANLEKAVKVLKEAGEQLDSEEKRALASTVAIADMRGLVDEYRNVVRDNRLMIDKLVKAEKENRRAEIVREASLKMNEHVAKLNTRIGGQWMPVWSMQIFNDAIKGMKSLDSMRDKLASALANEKIAANDLADRIERNAKYLKSLETPYDIAPDFAAICTKDGADFANLIARRVTAIKEAEAEKAEAAKKAEDARIAAAVEAERRAGEARAAAEADRIKGKADAGITGPACERTTASLDVGFAPVEMPAGNAASAASTPPSQDCFAVAGNVIDAPSLVTEFLALQACSPGEKKAMRATIEKWEAYRVKMVMARGLAVAA